MKPILLTIAAVSLICVNISSAFIIPCTRLQCSLVVSKQALISPPGLYDRRFQDDNSNHNENNKDTDIVSSSLIAVEDQSGPIDLFTLYTPTDDDVLDITVQWIQKTVIGLTLCPFAERPFKTKELSLHIIRGNDPPSIAEAVTEQLLLKRDQRGTAIVVCPEFHPDDFEEYLAMIQYLEQRVMTYFELHDFVQIAPFHPQFAFDGSGDDVECYTNRSPYPMMHVLRVDEVDRAVNKFLGGDPGKVWRRNKRLLGILEEKLGRMKIVKLLLGSYEVNENMDDVVHEALEQTKNEMDTETEDEKSKLRRSWVR